jgi:lysophospholipase L1-like esterase
VEADHAGFTGAGYANTTNAEGLGLVWHVYAAQSGRTELTVRYANGTTAARPGVFAVNGKNTIPYDFAPTAAWADWQSATIALDLVNGSNTLTLSATQASGLANIDALSFTRGDITPGNCATARIAISGQPTINAPVEFNAETFTKGADMITAFDWDFGDGAAASGKSVSHRYATTGIKSVTLTVTDRDGGQSVVQENLEIQNVAAGPIRVFIAGDSTVSTYTDTASPNDQAGWGQMLPGQYSNQVTVDNRAVGGRTARRFIDEGRLDAIWNDIRAGDYLLVQFGTNDGHRTATYTINGQTIPYYLDPQTDYKTWLQKYIDGAKARGVQLVFVTPPPRNSAYCTGGNGTAAHAQAMRELARANGVPLADLNTKLVTYLSNICPAPVPENFFLRRADGTVDGTHFQENGARIMSSMVADGMAEASLAIDQFRR